MLHENETIVLSKTSSQVSHNNTRDIDGLHKPNSSDIPTGVGNFTIFL